MKVLELLSLKGRNALVTGGSRGLGLQMAEALGEMGARVAITARKQDELEQAVSHLKKSGTDASSYVCDIGRREAIVPAAEQILRDFGKIDILVNNAGATWGAPAEDHPLEGWDKLVSVNLTGVFVLTQLVGKRSMIPAKWGRVINIASIAGLMGQDKRIVRTLAYNTTKGGLVNFTRALAAEWGEHGITVNAICPGYIATEMVKAVPKEVLEKNILPLIPLGRLGEPEEIARCVVFLACDEAGLITGSTLSANGGQVMV